MFCFSKNKWKRKFLGANEIPFFELLRVKFNYHPYTISKMWNTAVNRGRVKHQNVQTIRFEDLLQFPEKTIRDLCEFIGVHLILVCCTLQILDLLASKIKV